MDLATIGTRSIHYKHYIAFVAARQVFVHMVYRLRCYLSC